MSSKSRAMRSPVVSHGATSSLEQVRQAEGVRRIVHPERLGLRRVHHRLTTRRSQVVRLWITERVAPVLQVATDLPTTTRHDLESGSPRECKAGAESEAAGVRLRVQIGDHADAAGDLGDDVMPALSARETDTKANVTGVERA